MLYDDAVDAERDRLVDHFGLALGVLAAVEHLQVNSECLRLLFGAGEVGFKEIAGRKGSRTSAILTLPGLWDRGPAGQRHRL